MRPGPQHGERERHVCPCVMPAGEQRGEQGRARGRRAAPIAARGRFTWTQMRGPTVVTVYHGWQRQDRLRSLGQKCRPLR